MRVDYPNDPWKLTDVWQEEAPIFVVESSGEKPEVIGYLRLTLDKFPSSVWVSDFLVLRRLRRQNIGTRLLVAAQNWARAQDYQRIIIEMQSKNYPVSCLANKLGYEFCGYSDQYYFNQDIAMFYCRRL